MIQQYTGTPGSGKSLHAAHEIRADLRCGKYVISTMSVDTELCFFNPVQEWLFNHFGIRPKRKKRDKRKERFIYVDINDVTPEFFYEHAARYHVPGKEHQTTIYLDECVAIFSPTVIGNNTQLWNRWDRFLQFHRHFGFDMVIIPQSSKLISRKVIEYCEFEVRHFNRKHHGTLGFVLSLFVGGLFSYSVRWRGVKDKPLEQGWFTYKPLYGQMYNSYSMFGRILLPYKKEWERKKMLLSALCGQLNQIKEDKING